MKRIYGLLVLASVLLLQGCFDIVEQVLLHADGSGNFQLVLNLSRSRTKVNSLLRMKTVNGHPVPSKSEITERINRLAQTMRQVPGLKEISTKIDWDNCIVTLGCTFSKVEQLNTAVQKINEAEGGKQQHFEKVYGYDPATKRFSRSNRYSSAEAYQQLSGADKEVFNGATYTAIYRFDVPVQSVNHPEAKIAPNHKAVMLRFDALSLVTGKKKIDHTTQLSN